MISHAQRSSTAPIKASNGTPTRIDGIICKVMVAFYHSTNELGRRTNKIVNI